MLLQIPILTLALFTGITADPSFTDAPRVRRVADAEPPVQTRAPLGAVFTCYRRAHDDTRLDEDSIAGLCQGAADAGPVDCYAGARNRTPLAVDDAIALCRCAPSAAPVECFEYGRQTTRMDAGRIRSLCAPAERFDLDAACNPPSR